MSFHKGFNIIVTYQLGLRGSKHNFSGKLSLKGIRFASMFVFIKTRFFLFSTYQIMYSSSRSCGTVFELWDIKTFKCKPMTKIRRACGTIEAHDGLYVSCIDASPRFYAYRKIAPDRGRSDRNSFCKKDACSASSGIVKAAAISQRLDTHFLKHAMTRVWVADTAQVV